LEFTLTFEADSSGGDVEPFKLVVFDAAATGDASLDALGLIALNLLEDDDENDDDE
jgi:hypothetical protein